MNRAHAEVMLKFQQSVSRARLDAGLTLGAKVHALGGRLAAIGDAICSDYSQGEPPTGAHVEKIRQTIRELQTAIAVFSVAGAGGGRESKD